MLLPPLTHIYQAVLDYLKHASEDACRVSYLCQLRFLTATNREHVYIAEVQHFVRAISADGQLPVLRLAVCRLMRATDNGMCLKVTAGQLASTDIAMVEVDRIDHKLVSALDGNTLYGMQYCNTSSLG